MVYPDNRILLGNKKKLSTDILQQGGKVPVTNNHIFYGFMYKECPE